MSPTNDVLVLPPALSDRLVDEARAHYPAEACGFLAGNESEGRAQVVDVLPAINRSRDPRRFFIEARDVFAAMQQAKGAGHDIVGVFHSHPAAPAEPSKTDLQEAWGEWLHVIVAVDDAGPATMTCWRHHPDGFTPVSIERAR